MSSSLIALAGSSLEIDGAMDGATDEAALLDAAPSGFAVWAGVFAGGFAGVLEADIVALEADAESRKEYVVFYMPRGHLLLLFYSHHSLLNLTQQPSHFAGNIQVF